MKLSDRRIGRPALVGLVSVLAALCLAPAVAAEATELEREPQPTPVGIVEVGPPVTPYVFDGDVRDLPAPERWKPGDPVKEIPRRFYPPPGSEQDYTPSGIVLDDPLYRRQLAFPELLGGASFTTPTRNFPGQGYSGVNPPDTVGDVGPNHYIQMINSGSGSTVVIYDKSEPTPVQVASFTLDSLGSGQCANGRGDPIVLHDQFADRWMLSEFSFSGNNLCLYISQTSNPVSGGWFNYAYTAPTFPDYPKYGIWPTDRNGGAGSIIVTANDGGPGIYALNRGAMLSGTPGTYQRVTIPGLPGFGFEAATPADVDGATPPATGTPAIVMRHRDTENHSGPAVPGDQLEMWTFDVDWVTPANSVLANPPAILTSEFDSDLCGLTSFFCFPQPSGPTLDPLREIIMNRLQYRVRDDHEVLVGNLVTDVDGTNHGGVRWFELRRSGGGWTLHQEGTYAIDADHRWMAASAMDQSGNIAVAYNVSSTSTFPSLRYTGRLADDPLGVMTQPETSIHAGTAANSSNRYGDYSAMNLDPVDDCTFWFTGMDNTSSNWRTQIASFAFDACGCLLEPPPLSVSATIGGDNRIDVEWSDSTDAAISEYRVRRALAPGGPYETISTVNDTSPGIGGGAPYSFSDTSVSGGTTYYYLVFANDGAACTSPESNEASITATGQCTLSPLFDGLESVSTPFDATCTLELAWADATARCAGPLRYNVYRSEDPDFTPALETLIAGGISGNQYTDVSALETGTRYYYIVRAFDDSNDVEEGNATEVSAIPYGTLTNGTWTDDGGDTGEAKMILANPWSLNTTEGNLGPRVYKTGNYGNLTCAALRTPPLQLGASSTLSFSSKYDIENSWDKGEVQISNDGGQTWQRLAVGYPGTSTNASDNCGLPTGTYFTGTSLTWANYNASLAAWAGQLVQIRFLISSDSIVTRTGWWIDDVQVTDVDVPGDCITGSGCEDNPFVAVDPDGPVTICDGESVELSADLSGGNGPFDFQWTRDGIDIPGANGPTYLADEAGIHAYNVKVRAATCEGDATDGSPTVVRWRSTPIFDGLESLESGLDATCGVQLAWDPATTVCDGPVTYSIYRDTVSPVSLTAENRIRSGLAATSFVDEGGLGDEDFYFYVVQAVDASTGLSDGNTVEAGVEVAGPDDGVFVLFFDNFADPGTFPAWTVTPLPGHNCGTWAVSSSATQRPSTGSGNYALSNNSACASTDTTWNMLESPAIDADLPGLVTLVLGYDTWYNHNVGDSAQVQVWDGAAWQTLWTEAVNDLNAHQEWDVTAYANDQFKVRFIYTKAIDDEWFSVDNVFVLAEVDAGCLTTDDPPPVPDGSGVSAPLHGDRLTVAGDQIAVTWDVDACRATDYNLLYGALDGVASYALDGSVCSLGTSGAATWTAVPEEDLYFLVVGTNGAGAESSWGVDSAGNERNGPDASGQCAVSTKVTTYVCP